jgi:hypothetical protein
MRARATVRDASASSINTAFLSNLAPVIRWAAPVRSDSVNGVFVVRHELGMIPELFIADRFANIQVWATEDDRRAWTAEVVVLRGSAAGRVDVWVGTRSQ